MKKFLLFLVLLSVAGYSMAEQKKIPKVVGGVAGTVHKPNAYSAKYLKMPPNPKVDLAKILRKRKLSRKWPMQNVPLERVPKQYVDFADALILSINKGDSKFFDQSFDINNFIKRMMRGYKLPRRQAAAFKKGFMKNFSFGKVLCRTKAYYTFLGFQRCGNNLFLVLRLLDPKDMVNYHRILLTMKNGKPGIVDIYTFLGGEFIAKTIGRTTLQMLSLQNAKKTKTLNKLSAFLNASQKQQYDKVLRIYNTLPEKYRKDKALLAIYYRAACPKGIDSREFKHAVMNFEKYHSNNPSLDLMMLDSLALGKKYAALLKRVDNIEKSLGYKDAFLENTRGNIAFLQGKINKAVIFLERAIQLDNYWPTPRWSLISLYLKQKQWAKVCSQLDSIEKVFKIKINDLTKIPDYAEFVKSKEYKAWIKKQKVSAKG